MPDGFVLVLLALACAIAGAAIGFSFGRRRDVGTEVRLMHMEARTDAILNAAVDGIMTIDEQGRVESMNRAAEDIFGYRADEVIGRNINMLMPEPDRSQHDTYLRNYLWSGRAKIIGIGREVQGLRKDGRVFPMDLAVGEARIGGRRVFAGTIRDITSRKHTEGRLRESEARTRAILEAAVDGIITIDETGIIRSVNPAGERIFGYRTVEMVGRNVSMLMPEPYHSEHDGYLRNYMHTGQPRIIGIGREVQGRRKDGSVFPMDLAVGEGALGGGRIFAGIVRDITDRKAVDERLRAADERFRALVEGVRDYAITMLSPEGRVVSWNAGAQRIYGWNAEEAEGHPLALFYPPEAIQRDEPAQVLKIARTESRHEEEGVRVRSDGSQFWAHVVVTALRSGDGALTGFASVSRDMSESKKHEEDLYRAKDIAERTKEVAETARVEAERANLAKTKFLAAASHDLRQPVQAIFFFTSVLSHKLRGHAAKPILDDLQSSLEGLNILLDSLLDVSKLDAGLVTPKETDFSATALLERIAADFGPPARDKGLQLKVVSSSAIIRSDPALLARILQNLVSNAVRYTTHGRILLGCRRHGGRLTIEVRDTGIGIPTERMRDIFEEFTQLGNPERDRNQGLGLGLAIVERLARLLGHQIKVVSTPGRGSLFSVEVPLRPTPPSTRMPRPRRRPKAAVTANRMVVLIDDEPIVLKGLSMVLQSWGYQVLAGTSEEEIMTQLASIPFPPSIIVADYRLREGRTGTEAVAHIRDYYSSPIPSIIITGDTAPERLREAEASGLSILHKPVQPPALREILQETLDRPPSTPIH
ncbi:MAG: PAS domain S-box protein [Rhodospirillaceae bacterium]|nr:PAS domain S-box protein [Rhodospirillales bacterium]